jgi:hypothetical protein
MGIGSDAGAGRFPKDQITRSEWMLRGGVLWLDVGAWVGYCADRRKRGQARSVEGETPSPWPGLEDG